MVEENKEEQITWDQNTPQQTQFDIQFVVLNLSFQEDRFLECHKYREWKNHHRDDFHPF